MKKVTVIFFIGGGKRIFKSSYKEVCPQQKQWDKHPVSGCPFKFMPPFSQRATLKRLPEAFVADD